MKIAYLDPPYSRYFHELAKRINAATCGSCVALLSSPAYRLYTGDDRTIVWSPGEGQGRWHLPDTIERTMREHAHLPEFQPLFDHVVQWFMHWLAAEHVELCLIYSDARVFSAAAALAARELGVPCLYFERGAFRYSTTSLSAIGLNGRFDLQKAIHQPIAGLTAKKKDLTPRPGEHWMRPRFALFLARYSWACKLSPRRKLLRPKSLQFRHYVRLGLKQVRVFVRARLRGMWTPDTDAPMVFLPLQLSSDTQVRLYSPFRGNQLLIDFVVGEVHKVLPDAVVLIKKHPMDLIDYHVPPGAQMVEGGVTRFIHHSVAVVCINSTVGFEAAVDGKPVLCFGPSFYSRSPRITMVTTDDFEARFREALAHGDDRKGGNELHEQILRYYQAPGDVWAYTEEDLRETAQIVLQHAAAARARLNGPARPSSG